MRLYRAEAQGVASIMEASSDAEITGLQLYLDNQGVVKRLKQLCPIHPLQPEWDLLKATWQQLHQCKRTTHHVKGHQQPKPAAPCKVYLNNMVDELATAAHTTSNTVENIPPGYGVLLYINDEPITGKYGKEIHHAATTPDISDYYKTKHGWTDKILQTINWDAFTNAQKRFITLQQRNIHKYAHDWLPTGKV